MQQAFVAGAAVGVVAAGLAVVGLPSRDRHGTDSVAAGVSQDEPTI
jgi:hypothetical protein